MCSSFWPPFWEAELQIPQLPDQLGVAEQTGGHHPAIHIYGQQVQSHKSWQGDQTLAIRIEQVGALHILIHHIVGDAQETQAKLMDQQETWKISY